LGELQALRISHATKQQYSTGDMVNLMAVDAQRLSDCLPQIHNLWALPFQICLALWILFTVVGRACVAGVLCIVVFIACQWAVIRHVRRLQHQLLAAKDARMKLMAELLNAIKMIKLHAWERFFRGKVDASRDHEMAILYRVTGALPHRLPCCSVRTAVHKSDLWVANRTNRFGRLKQAMVGRFSTQPLTRFSLTPGKSKHLEDARSWLLVRNCSSVQTKSQITVA
jgi:ABC-type multidrug transport system fused ATPase/permease subunit